MADNQKELNEVSLEQASTEIGDSSMESFFSLVRHLRRPAGDGRDVNDFLSGQNFADFRFYYAPSLVVRSEAELFGVSKPRFAIRINTFSPGAGLVGTRDRGGRLALTASTIRPRR